MGLDSPGREWKCGRGTEDRIVKSRKMGSEVPVEGEWWEAGRLKGNLVIGGPLVFEIWRPPSGPLVTRYKSARRHVQGGALALLWILLSSVLQNTDHAHCTESDTETPPNTFLQSEIQHQISVFHK